MPRFNFSTAVTLSGDSLSGTADPQLNTASVFGNLSMERNAVVTSIQDLGANTPAIVGQSTIVFGMSTLSGSGALITGSGATGGTTHLEGRVTSSTTTIPSPTVLEIQAAEYAELEQALSDLRGLDDDEQWKIDDTVYSASVQVAAVLMQNSVPTPSVFTHGSKSVVFNWSAEGNNLYLTVSPSRLD